MTHRSAAQVSRADRVPPRTIAGYAVGSLGTGGFGTLPGLVLVYFLTDNLGVTALVAGLIVSLAKVWDVVIDPLIGSLSDRVLARTGSRRSLMLLGALTLPVFFIATFAVPIDVGPAVAAAWVLVAFMLTATSFSLFQVPYIALPAEITDRYDERTRLLTWRVVVLTVAILLFGAGGPLLRGLGDTPSQGYLLMAVVAGLVIAAGLTPAAASAPRRAARAAALSESPRVSLASHYRLAAEALRESQPFRALLGTFVLQGLATGTMLAAAQYVATHVLRSEDAVTLLFLALIAPALLFAPVWGVVARRIGKERGYLIASILFAVAAVAITGLIAAPGPWVYAPVALAGIAYAGMQALPLAMLPDVIAHDARARGTDRAGVFSGVWTAGETAGMALGATVLTLILTATGYVSSVGSATVMQPASAVTGIVIAFSLVPAVLLVASILLLRRYRLRRDDIEPDAREASATPHTSGGVA